MRLLTYKKQNDIGYKLGKLYYLTLIKAKGPDYNWNDDCIEVCNLIHDVALLTGAELGEDDLSVVCIAKNIWDREERAKRLHELQQEKMEGQYENHDKEN